LDEIEKEELLVIAIELGILGLAIIFFLWVFVTTLTWLPI